jgi:hypothetical protein
LNSLEIQEVLELLIIILRKTIKIPKTIILFFRKLLKLLHDLLALSITSAYIAKPF